MRLLLSYPFAAWVVLVFCVYLVKPNWLADFALSRMALSATAVLGLFSSSFLALMILFERSRTLNFLSAQHSSSFSMWVHVALVVAGSVVLMALVLATQSEMLGKALPLMAIGTGIVCFGFVKWYF